MGRLINKKVISITVLILSIVVISFFNVTKAKNQEVIANSDTKENLNLEKFDKYTSCDYSGGNVGWTECIIEALDRASAEREWKQRKLETIKDPNINVKYMTLDLATEQAKIRKWRENFDNFRDSWCEASHTFVSGSGTPGGIAECKLELELKAITDLDSIYYTSIMDYIGHSKGISDFEPSDADINLLIKTNKTDRGCVWLGEGKCDK